MTNSPLHAFLEARSLPAARALAARGLGGCRQLTDALDESVLALASPVLRPGLALVALGGYGRREQYRGSPIDLLFLGVDEAVAAAPVILQPLWNAGLRARYAVHSVDDAARAGRINAEVLIDYLDARLLGGDDDVYRRFLEARQRLVRRGRGVIHAALTRRHRARVQAEPWQSQEPDIVTSRGGLEELYAVRWIELTDAIAERRGQRPPGDPTAPLAVEHELLAQVRAAQHALSSQPGNQSGGQPGSQPSDQADDRSRLDEAAAVADLLGMDPAAMSRRVLLAMRRVDEAAAAALAQRSEPTWMRWGRMLLPPPGPAARPDSGPSAPAQLLATLRSIEAGALEPLPPTDWLERVLPEWGALRGLPNAAPFHLHPVDVHAVRTVVEARRAIIDERDAMGAGLVARELARDDDLLVAALVHEVAHALPTPDARAGGVIAERVASRLGLDAEAAQRLATVTDLHLLLPTVASRRDIAEPRVIAEVAEAVGDAATLHLLYLVAIADARATGPEAWSAWKAALMRTLYVRVLEHLRAGAPEVASATALRHDAVLAAIEGRFPRETIEAHLRALPPRYLLAMRPETVGDHLAMIAQAGVGVAVRHDRAGELDRLTIVTHDRPGMLALVTGVLAVHEVSVLGGNAYTRDDGVAMEIFHVTDARGYGIDEAQWGRISDDITHAFDGSFDIAARLRAARRTSRHAGVPAAEPAVRVDNTGADGYSVIEVNTVDRVGLLHAITSVLHEIGLDIHLAKVDTIGNEVADAFYVLRENGRRIEAPDEIERVRRRVIEAVTALEG